MNNLEAMDSASKASFLLPKWTGPLRKQWSSVNSKLGCFEDFEVTKFLLTGQSFNLTFKIAKREKRFLPSQQHKALRCSNGCYTNAPLAQSRLDASRYCGSSNCTDDGDNGFKTRGHGE